ncbi:MAG: ATP-grasp domain-containing protein [Pirellulales bacterium]
MNIFVFEFVTGGGFLGMDTPPSSLLGEGRAMVQALGSDFRSISAEGKVTVLRDPRFPMSIPGCHVVTVPNAAERDTVFCELARQADWTVVIAPEFDGHLADYYKRVHSAGGRILGPSSEFVEITSDKHRTADALCRAGVPVVGGVRVQAGSLLPLDVNYPAVVKRIDGAGSADMRLVRTRDVAVQWGPVEFDARLEPFVPGLAVSVAVLCGVDDATALAPCHQRIAVDDDFHYLGGSLPLQDLHARRATRLGMAAVGSIDGGFGYVGVDMVLDDKCSAESCSGDRVIEINPRLTTSYVGLRAAYRQNLARCMLALADGRPIELSTSTDAVEFDADGVVRSMAVSNGW